MSGTPAPLLRVQDLKVHFPIRRGLFGGAAGTVRAVDGVSLTIGHGEILALVGESGCGKSTTGYAILGMQPPTEGTVHFKGEPSHGAGRGDAARNMQIVFQDPTAALNPRLSIGASIAEPLAIHGGLSGQEREARVDALIELVGLDPSAKHRLPGEFSGGQRQRIVIARALALEPELIVCDEPVSALDVSIQSQILNLLLELQSRLGLAYLFISHDLSVVRHIADRVAIMYLGRIVEEGDIDAVFKSPQHPHTKALLSAVPQPDPAARQASDRIVLTGDLPNPAAPPRGCRFAPRCPIAQSTCTVRDPALEGEHHRVACFFPGTL